MSFATDTKVRKAVTDELAKAGTTVDAETLDDLVTNANTGAYQQIVQHFVALGYTQAQVDDWDMGETLQVNLGRFQVLVDKEGDSQDIGEWRRELDYWRQWLKDAGALVVDGVIVEPAGATRIRHGTLTTTNDLFRLDPDDSRRGEVTEW